ncbi:MAG TPA: ATP-binding protein [Gaiellaceae bacterium]|nr:ATP-binding protein [Gaiellaceae bacterium]
MSEEGRFVRLTIPARAEYITLGRLALTAIAGVRPLSDETLHDLKLALTEACTNSVKHAYGENGGSVDIVYELLSDRLAVEVGDAGAGFDPDGGRGDPTDAEHLEEGGLGIEIIRALTDEVEIAEREGGGSRLRFVKLLD